jgi:hypothetical protein
VVQGVSGARFLEERKNAKHYSLNGVNGRPVLAQDVKADVSFSVDVRVVDWCNAVDLGGAVGVRIGHFNTEFEDTSLPVSVILLEVDFPHKLLLGTSFGESQFYVWQVLVLGEVRLEPDFDSGRLLFYLGGTISVFGFLFNYTCRFL